MAELAGGSSTPDKNNNDATGNSTVSTISSLLEELAAQHTTTNKENFVDFNQLMTKTLPWIQEAKPDSWSKNEVGRLSKPRRKLLVI